MEFCKTVGRRNDSTSYKWSRSYASNQNQKVKEREKTKLHALFDTFVSKYLRVKITFLGKQVTNHLKLKGEIKNETSIMTSIEIA